MTLGSSFNDTREIQNLDVCAIVLHESSKEALKLETLK